jgi:hypothetical protein
MRNMLVIDAASYPEAIERLFEIWGSQQRDAIEAQRKAISGKAALPSATGWQRAISR